MISHLLSRTVGFNIKPVPPGTLPTEAMAMARAAFQASTSLRFALSESVAIVAIVLSFAVPPASWMTYLIGGVLALIHLAVNVRPAPTSSARPSNGSIEMAASPSLTTPSLAWLPARARRRSSAPDLQLSPCHSPCPIPSEHEGSPP